MMPKSALRHRRMSHIRDACPSCAIRLLQLTVTFFLAIAHASAGDAGSLVSDGYQLLASGEPTEAERRFTQALKLDPKATGAHEGLMWTYLGLGYIDKSIQQADILLASDPDNPKVQRDWLEIAVRLPARQNEVLAITEKFLDGKHSDPDAVEFAASILTRSKSLYRRGIELYEQLRRIDPENPRALLFTARQAEYDRDLIAALDLLQRAQAIDPESDEIRDEIAKIRSDARRLHSARIGPTPLIVLAVSVVPILFGSRMRGIGPRTYLMIAFYALAVVSASLAWLFLAPLD